MTQIATFAPDSIVARQYAAKLGKVVVVVPAMQWVTDAVGSPGSMSVVNGPIPAPNAAPTAGSAGGGNVDGAVQYVVTFYDSNTDTEGPQSAAVSFTASTDTVTVTFADTNSAANTRVTHRRVYRTIAGGSDFYFLASVAVATGTYSDNLADTTITANGADILDADYAAPATSTYGLIREHNSYLFMAGPYNQVGGTNYDHKVAFCKVGNADQWRVSDVLTILSGQYGIIRALSRAGDTLVIFKDTAIVEFTFTDYPNRQYGDGYGKTVRTDRGCLNGRCVSEIQGVNYVMDEQGIYVYSGGTQIVDITGPLRDFWDRINWAQRDRFCAVRSSDRIWFFVALDGSSNINWAFVYNLKATRSQRGSRWWVERYDCNIRDAVELDTGRETATNTLEFGRQTRPCIITDSGHLFYLGVGYRDGVAPRLTGRASITSSNTTTFTVSSGTFTATGGGGDTVNVKGCYVWFLDANEDPVPGFEIPYRITGISGTTLTVTTMPTSPYGAGARIAIIGGVMNTEYRSPQMAFGTTAQRKKPGRLHIDYQIPGAPTYSRLEIRTDRLGPKDNAATIGVTNDWTVRGTLNQEYVTMYMGGGNTLEGSAVYDRIGHLEVMTNGEAGQVIQYVIKASGIDKTIVIDRIELEITDRNG